jgi:serine/threonine protein kinase
VLGSGVGGVVHRARREGDLEPVAIKIIRDTLIATRGGLERFRREMRAATSVVHPHIVRVVDHGEMEGRAFLTMELVEGGSLGDLLERIEDEGGDRPDEAWLRVLDEAGVAPVEGEARSPAEAYGRRMAALFAPAARALAAAAASGLVHRDLKPGNLLLTRDGRLLVTDFGLARIVGEEITSTIAVLGTPGYMSPEQAAGRSREADARCDVYGLGATLYRALTMHYPVHGESLDEVLAAIQNQPPEDLRSFCSEYPAGLARVLARCLRKDPAERYPDAEILAEDLERVAAGRRPRQSVLPIRPRLRKLARRSIFPAAGLLVLAVFGVLWFTRPATVSVEVRPGARVWLDGRVEGEARPSWSRRIARGRHELEIREPGYLPVRETRDYPAGDSHTVIVHLQPELPFAPEILARLSKTYGVSGPPSGDPVLVRGFREAVPPPPDEKLVDRALSRWPVDIRGRPSLRVLAASTLLEEGHLAEAFALAEALAKEHPDQDLPLRIALAALFRLNLGDTVRYAELLALYEGLADG